MYVCLNMYIVQNSFICIYYKTQFKATNILVFHGQTITTLILRQANGKGDQFEKW